MRTFGIIINIFFPGVGTLVVGKIIQGIIQIVLIIIAIILNVTVVFAIIGIPLGLGTYVWALVSAATPKLEGPPRYRK